MLHSYLMMENLHTVLFLRQPAKTARLLYIRYANGSYEAGHVWSLFAFWLGTTYFYILTAHMYHDNSEMRTGTLFTTSWKKCSLQ